MPVQFLFIACVLLQEQPSQDGSRLNDISTEDGQLLLKSKKEKEKKVCVCVCVKKEMKGAATAHWVEKDITQSSVFQNAELFGRGFALSQKARQAPAY
jgi:uncharacterized protein (DUF2237 family)